MFLSAHFFKSNYKLRKIVCKKSTNELRLRRLVVIMFFFLISPIKKIFSHWETLFMLQNISPSWEDFLFLKKKFMLGFTIYLLLKIIKRKKYLNTFYDSTFIHLRDFFPTDKPLPVCYNLKIVSATFLFVLYV